jgi:uncharacterized Fe-S cluster protein YjdI
MSQKPPTDREELAFSHARSYTAPGVTVFYDRGRCLHFAECVRGLPQVFDVEKRPWSRWPTSCVAAPSGALHYRGWRRVRLRSPSSRLG